MKVEKEASPLRLGDFIGENMESILVEWEDFARRYWQGPLPGSATLRDDARIMLLALVQDMETSQSALEQKSKSEGEYGGQDSSMDRAALRHALARVNDGFDIARLVAEFRALRASVNRIWWESVPSPHRDQIEDMGRFNEALDQLVAASLNGFIGRMDASRRLFLGILGHDLRQPLISMRMFTAVLGDSNFPSTDTQLILSRMEKCCDSMAKMLADLLDFTTSQLGCTMPIYPAPSNLEAICREVLNEVQITAPDRTFKLESSGNLDGNWDSSRLRQIISNLLANAMQHGSADHAIEATLLGCDEGVTLSLHNKGHPIPSESIPILFDPMVRLASTRDRLHGSIGLGLYICRQIAIAHGGGISVESSAAEGTTFTVKLPRGDFF